MDEDLIFDEHAREEMQRDSIAEDDVYTIVGDYDEIIERPGGRTEYGRMLDDGRWIVVVVADETIVKTVWWDKRRGRRQRRRR